MFKTTEADTIRHVSGFSPLRFLSFQLLMLFALNMISVIEIIKMTGIVINSNPISAPPFGNLNNKNSNNKQKTQTAGHYQTIHILRDEYEIGFEQRLKTAKTTIKYRLECVNIASPCNDSLYIDYGDP